MAATRAASALAKTGAAGANARVAAAAHTGYNAAVSAGSGRRRAPDGGTASAVRRALGQVAHPFAQIPAGLRASALGRPCAAVVAVAVVARPVAGARAVGVGAVAPVAAFLRAPSRYAALTALDVLAAKAGSALCCAAASAVESAPAAVDKARFGPDGLVSARVEGLAEIPAVVAGASLGRVLAAVCAGVVAEVVRDGVVAAFSVVASFGHACAKRRRPPTVVAVWRRRGAHGHLSSAAAGAPLPIPLRIAVPKQPKMRPDPPKSDGSLSQRLP